MAVTDIGMPPPPPTEVQAQMTNPPAPVISSGGPGGMYGLESVMAGMDVTKRIMQLSPLLTELAKQVPALAPDINGLTIRLQGRMQGANPMAGTSALPVPPGTPMAGGGAPPPFAMGAPGATPPNPAMASLGPMPAAPVPTSAGVMGIAQQIELILPQIATSDPTLAPDVNFFVARMREEVSKVIQGQPTELTPPPTEQMMNRLPATY